MPDVVEFKKKSKAVKPTKKRLRKDDTDSSDAEDEIVRASAKSNNRGVGVSGTRDLTVGAELEVSYTGDRTASNRNVNDATREIADIDGYTEAALLGRKAAESSTKTAAASDAGEPKRKSRTGPIKAPANIRAISVIDYQPDVCKDYKQTGFCGFGDTCKFLHDRGDFKQGWQLDRDWEDVGKAKRPGAIDATKSKTVGGDEVDPEEAKIPFKCVICKGDYKSPIITKCGHYFCEACALERYKKTPACAQCGSGTGGLFSGAKKLKALLQSREKRIEEKLLDTEVESGA